MFHRRFCLIDIGCFDLFAVMRPVRSELRLMPSGRIHELQPSACFLFELYGYVHLDVRMYWSVRSVLPTLGML